ncbi:MAG: hypothetical protein ALECFALPRED_009380 [Alectoria fallacina]|uniref:Uncharacterized protein n=1 Tax=Alectoria fallacina TaxID=1903189 RepID=A0A8H3J7F4_9LECA|nr:MAG: hypothetical protein ALECFALPRED_009380 [Alectoria fallacina]
MNGGVVVEKSAYTAGYEGQISNTPKSVGMEKIVIDATTYALPTSTPLFIGGQSMVKAANGGVVIGTSIYPPGSQAQISNPDLSVGVNGVVVDGTSYVIPTSGAGDTILVDRNPISRAPDGGVIFEGGSIGIGSQSSFFGYMRGAYYHKSSMNHFELEPGLTAPLLYISPGILDVLQRIELKLEGHEERFKSLEYHTPINNGRRKSDGLDRNVDTSSGTSRTAEMFYTSADTWRPSRKGTPTSDDSSGDTSTALKVPYSQWSINQLDRFFNLSLSNSLEARLGDCWEMPDDNRLPLKFFKTNILKSNGPFGVPIDSIPTSRQPVQRDLEFLCQFDDELRAHPGNDFMVVDFDAADDTRLYRLGEQAFGSELQVEAQGSNSAPWSRLILYQGATTGESIQPTEKRAPRQPIPYFTSTDKIKGLWEHLDYHLQTKRRGITTNPYANAWNGFHTNFYEIREVTEWQVKELWKHGPLYGHPLGWHFRKCAYTIYSPVSVDTLQHTENVLMDTNRHWTLLVLAPDRFFNDKNTSFPMSASSPGRAQALGYSLGRLTQPGAELNLIGQGLERIADRWAEFLSYFDYILDGGDSLMKPAEHDNLLFDDGAFSRSRRYFWAIDCLSEFEISITDNITQWELYKAARVHSMKDLPEHDQRQLSFAERQYRVLQNQRESFRQKLASTKALRDALFNASAVIESRASTRLGENVKLLTFVSIFFLPLAFTTSLWSVNDQFSMTALIYVVIIVALVTYFIMFNINSLAQGFGQAYNNKKKYVVRAMKRDRNEAWKQRGQRFEVFRPKHESPEPSEWYIPFYALLHPAVALGLGRREGSTDSRPTSKSEKESRPSKGSLARLFRRRKRRTKEDDVNDQPWVIE